MYVLSRFKPLTMYVLSRFKPLTMYVLGRFKLLTIYILSLIKNIFLPKSDEGNVIYCMPFIEFMEGYKKRLNVPSTELFTFPKALKTFMHVYLFHEITEEVQFINTPESLVCVDMIRNPEKEIRFLNKFVRDQTNGVFQELDPSTQSNLRLRHKNFRYLLLGLFYLKAKWNGENVGMKPFYNKNKSIASLPFFTLESHRVAFFLGRVYVRVSYRCSENEEEDKDSFIIFSQPAVRLDTNCKKALIHLPEMTLEYRQESGNGPENLVMQFKYRQDEKGFEAAAYDSSDPIQDIYFDTPFRIEMFFKKTKVFQVVVNNLQNEPLPSLLEKLT